MPNVFPSPHPLVAHKVALLRDKTTKPKRFRELVREIAALMTYEATTDLPVVPRRSRRPLPGAGKGAERRHRAGANLACRVGHGGRGLGIDAQLLKSGILACTGTNTPSKPVRVLQQAASAAHGFGLPDPGPHVGDRRLSRSHSRMFSSAGG